ncbi:hypothetical protein cypCar_00032240, partial [Cyprinus carpio]
MMNWKKKNVVYKLLASKSESIQVQALKVLAYFLKHLGHNVSDKILTEQVCTQVVHKPHAEPDSTVKIQNP